MLDEQSKRKLIEEASKAREHAYAPYSKFKVGAAVLTEDGSIFSGSNIENASYGATICAEQVAIFKAVTAGHRHISAAAVIADLKDPVPPCGICRQELVEFGPDAEIIMLNLHGQERSVKMSKLLPCAFSLQ
jgi:cytidine deaminase